MTMFRIILAVIVVGFLAWGCGGDGSESTGTTLERGLAGDFNALDPHKNTTTQGHRVLIDLYEGLVRYSSEGKLENGVAKSWSVSDDGLEYQFYLHTDARWSNGDPLTAGDFVYSFRRLVKPSTAAFYGSFLAVIENASEILSGNAAPETLGVEAIDDHTLLVRLTKPTVYFPQLLTHPSTAPLHARSMEEYGETFTKPGNLVSNGAYVLEDYLIGSVVKLKKNNHYREKDEVRIDNVNYHIIVDGTSMYNMYRAGDLHVTGTVPLSKFDVIRQEIPEELKIAPQLGVYYYGFNLTREPFRSNAKLRAALSMAIDREALVSKVTGRGEVPAYSWVPPGLEGYESAQFSYASLSKEERENEARRLYTEAGFSTENPAKFELRYNIGEGEQRVALAIQSMWREVLGAEAELVNEEFKVLIANIMQKEITEAFRLSWIGDYFDPNTFLELMETDNAQNLTGYSNAEFDRLMALARVELDEAKRMSLMQEAESIMLPEHPTIPLYYYVSKHLIKPEVKGWVVTTVDFHPSRNLWLEDEIK